MRRCLRLLTACMHQLLHVTQQNVPSICIADWGHCLLLARQAASDTILQSTRWSLRNDAAE